MTTQTDVSEHCSNFDSTLDSKDEGQLSDCFLLRDLRGE